MNQKKHIGNRLLEVIRCKNRQNRKLFKKELLVYLNSVWQLKRDPCLKELVNNLHILDNETKNMLIQVLRHLRVMKVLDGYYDSSGIYRIGNFKQNIIK